MFEYTHYAVSHANVASRAGDLFASEADARAAYEVAREEGWPLGLPTIVHYLDRPPAELSDMYTSNLLLFARAGLWLASGDPQAALADLEELAVRLEGFGERNPSLCAWRSAKALTLAQLGDREAAVRLAAEEVELARIWGAPRAHGMALRAAGMVEEGERQIELPRDAARVLEGSFARLEYARALADLGDTILAGGDRTEARSLLRGALELTHASGAARLEERVRASLRRAGARPRRAALHGPAALTPRERRIAEMAAGGLTNREIADAIFVTTRTVEYHLHNAYRKLDIDGRARLREAIDDAGARQERL